MGNICCPKQQPQSSNLNGSVLSSALDDNSIDSSFHFKYDTDKLFFGYPKHKELTQKLYEIQNSNSSWAAFEKELQYNKEKVNKYFNFLHDVQKDLQNLIINGVQAMQRVKAKHLDLPNDFKTDLEHCFIIELQEIVIESAQLEETSLMMSFRLTNPQYGIDKQYDTPIKSVNKKKSIYNYFQQIPLNPIDKDQFEVDGNIVPYKDYFTNFNFSIQLYQLTQGNYNKLGSAVNFQMVDLQSQQIHEKILRIQDDSQIIAKGLLRFQLVFNIRTFLEWWMDELDSRQNQIDRMLKQIGQRGKTESTDNQNDMQNFQSLMSSNGQLRAESKDSYYDLAYIIK